METSGTLWWVIRISVGNERYFQKMWLWVAGFAEESRNLQY
jgi:hypothetical protein